VVIAIIAGLPNLLVHRREVLKEAEKASVTATIVAAGTPHNRRVRKTKTSPDVIDVLLPAIVIAPRPARNPTVIRTKIPTREGMSRLRAPATAYTSAARPSSRVVHQDALAAAL